MKELISNIKTFDNAHALALTAFIPCVIPGSREKVIDILSAASADDLHDALAILAHLAAKHPEEDNRAALALVHSIA